MNIAKDFTTYMVAQSLGILGNNIFIGNLPAEAPDPCWQVLTIGGGVDSRNNTGERIKAYTLAIYYRSLSAEDVYDTLHAFEETVNTSNACTQLENFDTISMEATLLSTDDDLDNEDRTVGLVQVTVTTYK